MNDDNNNSQQNSENKLSPEQFRVLKEKGTEGPFTGKYYHHDETGTYHCASCDNNLFKSDTKYDSGSGWPSFWDVVEKGNVKTVLDKSHGMTRTEIQCANCGGHLGHLFTDGPEDKTGLRYCVNSASLQFLSDK